VVNFAILLKAGTRTDLSQKLEKVETHKRLASEYNVEIGIKRTKCPL
jgi:hypothetical protein